MFDNTKPNIILLTDSTNVLSMTKVFGAHKVAYVLRRAGYEVVVIDHASVFSIEEIEHLLSQLISDQTLFIGVNSFYYNSTEDIVRNSGGGVELRESDLGSFLPHHKRYNQQLKKLVNKINPSCKYVAGGPNVRDIDEFKDFDYIVFGYSEISVVNLANHLNHQVPLEKSFRSIYGPIIINDAKAESYDFSASSMQYEAHDVVLDQEVLYLEVGRGCIFNCSFCSFPLNGKKKFDYVRHQQLILEEILDNYKKFNVTKYMIVDDTFNDTVEKCQMIYEITQQLPFKLEYWAYIRLDLLAAKPQTIDLLVNSGCRGMYFGIETFDLKSATAIRKGGSREKLISTINQIKDRWGNQVSLHGSFILGLPYEDVDSMQQTLDFLISDQNRLDSWQISALRIKHPSYNSLAHNDFLSDIDRNYEKYGYKCVGIYDQKQLANSMTKKNSVNMLWKNQYTNFDQMEKLAYAAKEQGRKHKKMTVTNSHVFELSGLGIDLDKLLTVPHVEMDWQSIDQKKLSKAIEYKKTLFDQLNISNKDKYFALWANELDQHQTFSSYLTARGHNRLV